MQINNTTAETWRQAAWRAIEAGKIDDAIAAFREVTRLDPDFVEAWANLGALQRRQGKVAEAAECYLEAATREPGNVALQKTAAHSLRDAGRRDAALWISERMMQSHPQDIDALQLYGNLLQELDRYEEAIANLERAISLAGRTPNLLSNLGIAKFRRGDLDEAIALFREAITLRPDYADGHFHLGMALLLSGDYANGWNEYEWRPGGRRRPNPNTPLPMWNGASLAGKTIIIAAEQGYGDTIQFARFAKLLKQQVDCRTILYCQKPLVPILKTAAGFDAFVPTGEPIPKADCYLPLLSLASCLNFDPAKTHEAAYLHADKAKVATWRSRLQSMRKPETRLRIGISWQGDPKFPADCCRSIPLATLAPLARPEIEFVSLQKGFGREQIAPLRDTFPIIDFGNELDSFGGAFLDTAAIMQSLDVVITTDTAVAHVAGALGVPTWLLLAHVPDWRWHVGRSDSPWYPSMRLFRQARFGDWMNVVEEVGASIVAK